MPTPEIVRIINSKVIPWTTQNDEDHFVVARPVMRQDAMPDSVQLSANPIIGKRVIRRDSRRHGNQRLHIADWPDANLHEIAPPKLACIVSGRADYLLGKYTVRCDAGSFILIPSGASHQRSGPFLRGDHLVNGSCQILHAYAYSHGIFVWLNSSRNGQHASSLRENYLIPSMPAANIFQLLSDEAKNANSRFERVCNSLLSAFLVIVARDIEAGRFTQASPKLSDLARPNSDASFADQLKEYLSANCHEPLKLADVASHFYMSIAQLTRRARNEVGATFVELLTAARIERAKELLRETDWTFNAIASFCSFKSSSYFLHLFHQRVGCTPMEYRHKEITKPERKRMG